MSDRQLIRIVAPSEASATCLLSELTPVARVRTISDVAEGCELLVAAPPDGLDRIVATVSEWLRDCNLACAEVRTDERVYTVIGKNGGARHLVEQAAS